MNNQIKATVITISIIVGLVVSVYVLLTYPAILIVGGIIIAPLLTLCTLWYAVYNALEYGAYLKEKRNEKRIEIQRLNGNRLQEIE